MPSCLSLGNCWTSCRARLWCDIVPRRGAIMLELLVSVALFVGAASVALSTSAHALRSVERSNREQYALDLARSKLAELEAGLITLADLREGDIDSVGSIELDPVRTAAAPYAAVDEWRVDVQTSRSEFRGLSLVEVTISAEAAAGSRREEPEISITLRQLMRLRADDADEYEADDLLDGFESQPLPGEAGGPP